MIQQQGEALENVITSISGAYLFFNTDFFVLNRSDNLRNQFCWSWIMVYVNIAFNKENTKV